MVEKAKNKARLSTRFPVHYPDHIAKIADAEFMKSVRDYSDKIGKLYQELSAVRMPAAKHELPKKRGEEPLIADAPGFGLPDPHTGSMCWPVLLDGATTTIRRRKLADEFLGILSWDEDIETFLALAKDDKARRKRLRREARRHERKARGRKALDEFFRTVEEADRDEDQPAMPLDPEPYFVKKPTRELNPKKEEPPRNPRRR
jgi:hypothetical protein